MKEKLIYKNDIAEYRYDADDAIYFGTVLGMKDVISFHGETVEESNADFKAGVDHYLEDCQQEKRKPEQPWKIEE